MEDVRCLYLNATAFERCNLRPKQSDFKLAVEISKNIITETQVFTMYDRDPSAQVSSVITSRREVRGRCQKF